MIHVPPPPNQETELVDLLMEALVGDDPVRVRYLIKLLG